MAQKIIYLAGGCFWGVEHLMQSIPGVLDAESGYANGSGKEQAVYTTVKTGTTGFRETVKVTYDAEIVSLEEILLAYFYVVDTTVQDRQGEDIGSQYQTGIYYIDAESEAVVRRIAAIEMSRGIDFFVEIKGLENFFPAEEYHQNYLVKNPDGYCHIPFEQMDIFAKNRFTAEEYVKPAVQVVGERLAK